MRIGDLKIKIVTDPVTGEKHVPPDVMRLLTDFSEHRNLCEQCKRGYDDKTADYCVTGQIILNDLVQLPEVVFVPK